MHAPMWRFHDVSAVARSLLRRNSGQPHCGRPPALSFHGCHFTVSKVHMPAM
jgi:hypothetical protein